MAEGKTLMTQGPELENEVLTETVRRMQKQGIWFCGTRRFSLSGEGDDSAAVILAAVSPNGERLLTFSSGDDGAYDSLLQPFAQALVLRGEAPQEIRAEDALSERILGRFCRTVGISLNQETENRHFGDAEWLSDLPGSGKQSAETDSFFQILMQLRDEEFARMPQDLAQRLLEMSEKNLAPKKLAERIQTLCQK